MRRGTEWGGATKSRKQIRGYYCTGPAGEKSKVLLDGDIQRLFKVGCPTEVRRQPKNPRRAASSKREFK